MTREIIINAGKKETNIAILENGELVELYIESPESIRTIGDIYLAKVRKIMPSIQAAFVDIGQKQDAFLHFSDVSENLPGLLKFIDSPDLLSKAEQAAAAQTKGDGEPDTPEVKKSKPAQKGKSTRRGRRGGSRRRGSGGGGDQGSQSSAVDAEDSSAESPSGKGRSSGGGRRGQGRRNSSSRRGRTSSDAVTGKKGGNNRKDSSGEDNPEKSGSSGDEKRGPSEERHVSFAAGHTDASEKLIDAPETNPVDHLKRDQKILVQITKEPIANKGSRVTSGVTLAGRFMVLVPMADYVAVSKKIYSTKERRRLRALARSLLPEGFGIIVRTVAEDKNAKTLDTDLRLLLDKWRKIEGKLKQKPEPPTVIHQDVNMASSIIRDLFTDDYDRILVDDPRMYRNIKSYIQAVAPQMVAAVKLHEDSQHVFDAVGIASDTAAIYESRIDLPNGGYLFIEKTEAMHVIDVNSGRAGKGRTQEENSLRVNLDAARLIAKQLRLRDLGGIIVVDFIDLREDANRKKVFDELRRQFRKDRAVTKILPMSDFGLMQITRQRLRPSVSYGIAPTFVDVGSQAAKSEAAREAEKSLDYDTKQLINRVERWLLLYHEKTKKRAVTLKVHPFTASFLSKGVPNYLMGWLIRHFVRVKLITDESMDPMEFRFVEPGSNKDITDDFDYAV